MAAKRRLEARPAEEKRAKTETVGRNVEQVKDSLDWLPAGWTLEMKTRKRGVHAGRSYKVYYDPFTGQRFYSKAQVFRHLEAPKFSSPMAEPKRSIITGVTNNTSSSTNQKEHKRKRRLIANVTNNVSASTDRKKKSINTNNTNNVQTQIKYDPNGLPNGWIKETRYRDKKTPGSKVDKYYTDPVNGYVFRSLKDVFRYIETGKVSKYAFKRKNGSTSDMHASQKDSHLPTAAKNVRLRRNTVKRCLFSVKIPDSNAKTESGISGLPERLLMPLKHPTSQCEEGEAQSCCTTLSNINHLKEGNTESAQINTGIYPPCSEVIMSVQPLAYSREDILEPAITRQAEPEREIPSEMRTEPLQMKQLDLEIKDLSRLPEKQCEAEDLAQVGLDNTKPLQTEEGLQAPKVELLEETKSELKNENQLQPKKFGRGHQSGSRKTKVVRKITMPLRASKRLAGHSADPVASPRIAVELSLRRAAKVSNQLQSNPAPVLNTAAGSQMDATLFLQSEEMGATGVELPDILKSKEHVGDLATPEKQVQPGKLSDDKSKSPLTIPFGDSWPDPCIEFAFKTLTGDIPVLEDTATFQRYFDQQLGSIQSPSANGSAPLTFGSSKNFS